MPGENAAVEQLLAERDALHGWLERLDAASVAAPDAVRERVRRDYQQRLDQLTSALREHGDTIADKLAADQGEFAELSARTAASRDELAEVELRHVVGEYPVDRYESERRRHLSDIETFELSLAAVQERVTRMEEVLSHVRRAPRAPDLVLDDEPQSPEVATSILDLAPDAAPPVAEQPAAQSLESIEVVESIEVLEPVETMEISELAPEEETEQFLSVFEEDDARPAGSRTDEAPASAAPPANPEFGPLSFRPTGAAPNREAPPIGMPADSRPRFVRPGDRLTPSAPSWPSAAPGAASAPAPEPEPALAPVPVQAPPPPALAGIFSEEIVATGPAPTSASAVGRTLKCSECGAMNRPLEWYCEKCGAELTAV